MSDFSELLSKYIHSKNIKVYSLAQYCGLDRSNMYKIINGKRKPPSLDIVDKMCHFMHLLPSEELELKESYQISLIGYENYYRRKGVLAFFESFDVYRSSLPLSRYYSEGNIHFGDLMPLNSSTELNQALLYIIFSERNHKDGYIRMLAQPDYDFLLNILTAQASTDENTYVEHILCFNNDPGNIHSERNYNLICLQKILPLYGSNFQYDCYYYYDNMLSKTGTFNLFPYIVITSQYACLFTTNHDYGFVTSVPQALKMFEQMFDTYRQYSSTLFRRVKNAFSYLQCMQDPFPLGGAIFSFQMMPCITPFLTPALADKYILPELTERENVLRLLDEHIASIKKYPSDSITYIFSYEGLLLFMETGRTNEYPYDAYTHFNLSDRKYLIKQLLQACKSQNYRMLKKNLGSSSNHLYMLVSKSRGYLMFASPDKKEFTYLYIEEPGLLSTFGDFFEHMDTEMFYTKEETLDLLRRLIKNYP